MEFTEILQLVKQPRKLSDEELKKLSPDFYSYLYDDRVSYDLFLLWDDFFQKENFNISLILDFADTFFLWYSKTFFQNFNRITPEHLASILPYTFMMGFYLDLEVPYMYTDYMMTYIAEDKDQTKIHKMIVEKVKNLQLPFDYKNGLTIEELIKLKLDEENKNTSEDNIEESKLRGRIEEFLSKNDIFLLRTSEQKVERISRILDFLKFFSDPEGIDKFRIYYLEHADYLPETHEFEVADWLYDAYFRVNGNPVLEEVEKIKKRAEEKKKAESSKKKENITLSYPSIKSQLEQEFSYDESGELQPIENVLARLSQLAEENNDENIEELYMFDEETGKFMWNEDLINQK